jgi:hypothetical protein
LIDSAVLSVEAVGALPCPRFQGQGQALLVASP